MRNVGLALSRDHLVEGESSGIGALDAPESCLLSQLVALQQVAALGEHEGDVGTKLEHHLQRAGGEYFATKQLIKTTLLAGTGIFHS